jgi:hypothetical protein
VDLPTPPFELARVIIIMCVRYYNAFLFEQSDNAIIGTRKNFYTQTLRGGTHPNVHTGVFCPKRRKGIFQMASPFLPVFFNDMRVSEIQIDGPGGQPVMPYAQLWLACCSPHHAYSTPIEGGTDGGGKAYELEDIACIHRGNG